MNDSTYKIYLDINEHRTQVALNAKLSDTGRKIYITLRAGGTPYTISDDCYAVFAATKPDGSVLYNACTIENNEIIYEFTEQTCSAVGRIRCEIKLYGKDEKLITSPRFALLVDGTVYPDGRLESQDEFSALTQMVSDSLEAQALAREAAEDAKSATNTANIAAENANEAAKKANDAANIGQIAVKKVVGTDTDIVYLRDLESGMYSLQGIFYYRKQSSKLGISDPVFATVSKKEEYSTIQVFWPSSNIIRFVKIYDDSEETTIVKLNNMESVENRVSQIDSSADDDHYPTAKAVLNAIGGGVTDEKYFSIDDDGMVSLHQDYQAGGALNAELPDRIVIPDIINGIAVSSLAPSMFKQNNAVKSLTIPSFITEIPASFCSRAMSLEEINGTENVTTISHAAFQGTRLKKAVFPNLKSFDGISHFNLSAFLTTVDIGNEVTEIPENCFRQCEGLTDIIGGASVRTIGKRAFYCTYSLRNLPFAPNLTAIGEAGIYHSGVNYNWQHHYGCTFGTAATWAQYNKDDYWSSVNAKECSIALRSTFSQMNPQWLEDARAAGFPEKHVTYADSCATASQAVVYSAYNGIDLISPVEYMIAVRDSKTHPGVMDIIGPGDTWGNDGVEDNDGIELWMQAVGFTVDKLYIDTTDTAEAGAQVLQDVYDALAEGKFVIADVISNKAENYGKLGHAVVLYGVNNAGEFLIVDSSNNSSSFGDYSPIKYSMPVQNFAPMPTAFYIISKGE